MNALNLHTRNNSIVHASQKYAAKLGTSLNQATKVLLASAFGLASVVAVAAGPIDECAKIFEAETGFGTESPGCSPEESRQALISHIQELAPQAGAETLTKRI